MLLAEFGPKKRIAIVDALLADKKVSLVRDKEPELLLLAERLIDGLTLTVPGSKNGNVTADLAVATIQWTT